MIYDIYEQGIETQDIVGKRKVTRYYTEDKKKAFQFMDAKNKVSGCNVWRVAVQIDNRIFFDIDNDNIENVREIKAFYEKMFGELKVIKTYHGYHLKSKPYKNPLEWQYDTCRVLFPFLEKNNMVKFIEQVRRFYRIERDKQRKDELDRTEFLDYFPKQFMESGLYFGVGEFDILFAINVIMKGYYCIRISKKGIDDKPKYITI